MKNKKRFIQPGLFLFVFIILINAGSACTLNANLINQDPYPVTPGESVKLIFQVTGVNNRDCGEVRFTIMEDFPFTVDPSMSATKSIQAGIYVRDYSNFWLVPYILRVDKNAIEGDNKLDIILSSGGTTSGIISGFDINIKDIETDFEVYVRDYSASKGTITFEIVNIGKNDVDTVSVEIPSQENMEVRGSRRNTIGILDSNEYTTTTFDAIAKKGEIKVLIHYNDITGIRRTTEESMIFDPSPFAFKDTNGGIKTSTIIIIILLVAGIGYWYYKRHKKKKRFKKEHHGEYRKK